tara:strand:+ start:1309 stop:1929 length:621 start_codon:yes stop_codon:yes gene_type:complete
MSRLNERIILNTLHALIAEQAPVDQNQETNNKEYSVYTPEEQKFLGKFDTYGSKHLGVIYSLTDIGIREFITRSGAQLQCTPGLLFQLLRDRIIKIVPAGGYGGDTDYTIELQLSLDDIKGMGEEQSDSAGGAAAGDAGGGDEGGVDIGGGAPTPAGGGEEEEGGDDPPDLEGPPVEWIVNYKDIINESTNIARRLVNERNSKKKV